MEQHVAMFQARLLLFVGLGWMAVGLYLGYDPVTVALRAALAATVACVVGGLLIRMGARVIAKRLHDIDAAEQADEAPAT